MIAPQTVWRPANTGIGSLKGHVRRCAVTFAHFEPVTDCANMHAVLQIFAARFKRVGKALDGNFGF